VFIAPIEVKQCAEIVIIDDSKAAFDQKTADTASYLSQCKLFVAGASGARSRTASRANLSDDPLSAA
jgi:hypothetical protein